MIQTRVFFKYADVVVFQAVNRFRDGFDHFVTKLPQWLSSTFECGPRAIQGSLQILFKHIAPLELGVGLTRLTTHSDCAPTHAYFPLGYPQANRKKMKFIMLLL